MATKRRKPVVTHAELRQKLNEVRAKLLDLLEPPGESWEAFCQRSQATLYETTIRAWEEARSRFKERTPADSLPHDHIES